MRIVLVSFDMPWSLQGGVEHHVDRLATALAENHHDEVTVITRAPSPAATRAYRTLRAAVPGAARLAGGGYRFRLLAEAGFGRRASDLAAATRPDIVHFQDFGGRPDRVAPARTAATIHVPLEVSYAEGRAHLREGGRLSWWRRAAMDRFYRGQVARARSFLSGIDHLFTVSAANAQVLVENYGVWPMVIPNGVDRPRDPPDRATARHRLGWPLDRKIALFLGRLEPAKRPLRLAHAASERWQVVVAGAGSLETDIREAAARDPNVRFIGRVDDATKSLALRAADVVALPSRAEGQPVVLLEALAAGTPVYATSAAWLPPDLQAYGAYGEDVATGLDEAARIRVPSDVVPTWADVAGRFRQAYTSGAPQPK